MSRATPRGTNHRGRKKLAFAALAAAMMTGNRFYDGIDKADSEAKPIKTREDKPKSPELIVARQKSKDDKATKKKLAEEARRNSHEHRIKKEKAARRKKHLELVRKQKENK